MDALTKIAEMMLIQRVMGPYAPLNAIGKLKIVLAVLIGLFAFMALIFLLVGYYMWLEANYQLPQAMMLFGASVLALSIVMMAVFHVLEKVKDKKKQQFREKVQMEITEILLLVDQKIHENNPVENHPMASIITSALCGYAVGEKAACSHAA